MVQIKFGYELSLLLFLA